MAFLVKADYYTIIRQLRLDQMVDNTDAVITQVESEAVAVVKQYLFNIYDVNDIFAATGGSRDPLVLLFCKHVAVYLLHKRLPGAMIPEHVKDDYLETLRQLESIAKGKTAIDLPRKKESDTNGDGTLDDNTVFRWGKREVRTH